MSGLGMQSPCLGKSPVPRRHISQHIPPLGSVRLVTFHKRLNEVVTNKEKYQTLTLTIDAQRDAISTILTTNLADQPNFINLM